jgi:hypothetical protein
VPLMLPAIEEEKGNGFKSSKPPYHHSVSMVDTAKFGVNAAQSDLFFLSGGQEQQMYGFVELDVLSGDGDLGSREWKEMARWIKVIRLETT